MLETLKQYYQDYDAKTREVRKKSSFIANFFGTGESVQRHHCHEVFYENVEAKINEYAATEPQSADAAQVALFLLETPAPYKETNIDCYWFMYVCVGQIRTLIPYLNKEDCAMLAEKMNALYKKRDRMPVQEETYKMLCKKAKG